MKKFVLIVIHLFILCFVLLGGCIISKSSDTLPPGKYIAITETLQETGIIIEGSYPFPWLAQPGEIFVYSASEGNYPGDYPTMNDSLKVLYGFNYVLNEPGHLTNNLIVYGIYDYPYQLDSGAKILSIDSNGTIYMYYNNTTFNLKVNSAWTTPEISTRIEKKNGTSYYYVASYNKSYKISNLGLYNKSELR